MIVSTLKHSDRIESLHPLFKTVFDYVKSHDLLSAPCGRIELQGDDLFINNVNPECVAAADQVLEVHHQYIDIHILLEGEETIGWKPIEDCTNQTKPYDADADCELYAEPASAYTTLKPGQFMIVWPEDPHAPVIGKGKIRKLIVKVKL